MTIEVQNNQILFKRGEKKGEKLIILEAMKMQTTVYALTDGIIDQVEVQAGDQVESKDLLVKLR